MQTKSIESIMTDSQRKIPVKNLPTTLVTDFFIENKEQISAILPASIRPEKLIYDAIQCTRQNPRLLECSTDTLFGAIMECAQLGLELTKGMNHAHLVPFWETKTGSNKVNLIPGYAGLISLAIEHPSVLSITPKVVYENDDFSYKEGSSPSIDHSPAPYKTRGEPIAYYAIAQMKDGGFVIKWMWKEEVDEVREAVRKKNKGKNMHIWNQHYEAMALKTTVRRICKYLPRTPQLGRLLDMSDNEDIGKDNCFTVDSVSTEMEVNKKIEEDLCINLIEEEKISSEQLEILSSKCMELTLDEKIDADRFYSHLKEKYNAENLQDLTSSGFEDINNLLDRAYKKKEG